MNINWKIFTDTTTEDKTKKVFLRFVEKASGEYADLKIESYHKGGFVCSFTMPLVTTSWPDAILETLLKAQMVGRGWTISGDIDKELDAWSNETAMPGIRSLHIVVVK